MSERDQLTEDDERQEIERHLQRDPDADPRPRDRPEQAKRRRGAYGTANPRIRPRVGHTAQRDQDEPPPRGSAYRAEERRLLSRA